MRIEDCGLRTGETGARVRALIEAAPKTDGRLGSRADELRRAGAAAFLDRGFPTTRDEEWKYTNTAPIAATTFAPVVAGERHGLANDDLTDYTGDGPTGARLVFVDGRYAPELSSVRGLPKGVELLSLAEALATRRDAVEATLGRLVPVEADPFASLNAAFLGEGAFVRVADGAVANAPLHILHVATGRGSALAAPRTVIAAGARSRAVVVETFAGPAGGTYLTTAVTEIEAGPEAALDHVRVQEESETAFHVSNVAMRLGRGTRAVSHNVAFGGALARTNLTAILNDVEGDVLLNGLYHATGSRVVDNHTTVDHAKPHGHSFELYKGVLDGRATGVFNGKIYVRQDAQKTDAKQTNKGLLLSEEATINSKPQLEIFADDVKCTHGATVGFLDENALFYLRTRGFGKEAARAALTHAFANEVLGRLPVESARARLERALLARLESGLRSRKGRPEPAAV